MPKNLKFSRQEIMPNLMDNLDHFFWMSPNDFKNDYNSMYGAGFSIAPIFINQLGLGTTIKVNMKIYIKLVLVVILVLVCLEYFHLQKLLKNLFNGK